MYPPGAKGVLRVAVGTMGLELGHAGGTFHSQAGQNWGWEEKVAGCGHGAGLAPPTSSPDV